MSRLARNRFAYAITAVLASGGYAWAQGLSADGKVVAEHICAICHVVAPDQKSANADVPTFMAVARKYAGRADVLQAFLVEPHSPMPDLSLTRREIDNLIAYIESLQ